MSTCRHLWALRVDAMTEARVCRVCGVMEESPCASPPFTWVEACRVVQDMSDGCVTVVLCPVCRAFHVEVRG